MAETPRGTTDAADSPGSADAREGGQEGGLHQLTPRQIVE